MSGQSLFLVTMSNQAAYSGRPVMMVVDVESGAQWLVRDLLESDEVLGSSGGAGLCATDSGYALLLQGFPTRLCMLRSDLSLERTVRLSLVEDAHSVVWTGRSLLAVSTETNAIVEIGENDSETVIHTEGTPNSKSEHLNGIALDPEGNIILSGFGDRPGSGQAARNGYLKKIATGEVLVGNLREPHSVQYHNGVLYTCESQTGNLVRSRDGRTISCFQKFFGYVRGLAFNRDYTVVGQSALRFRSRKALDRDESAEAGRQRPGAGGLYVISSKGQRFLALSPLADEVYDVVALPPSADVGRTRLISAAEYLDGNDLATSWLFRGFSARNAGNTGGALLATEEAVRVKPGSAANKVALGAMLITSGRLSEAEAVLREAVATDPSNAHAHDFCADIALATHRFDDAAGLGLKAISLAPNNKSLRHSCGVRFIRMDRFGEAEMIFSAMLDKDPEGDSTQRFMAGALHRQDRNAEALVHANTAIKLRPDAAEYYAFAAKLLALIGDLPAAIREAREAVDLEPSSMAFQEVLVEYLARNGDANEAVAAAEEALHQNPDDPAFKTFYGECLIRFKDPEAAVSWFEHEVAKAPNTARLYHALSRAQSSNGDLDSAIKSARNACRLAPSDPNCVNLLGYALAAGGLTDEAITRFREALDLDPEMPDVWCAFGESLAKNGRMTEAAKALNQAVRLRPGNARYRSLLEKFTL